MVPGDRVAIALPPPSLQHAVELTPVIAVEKTTKRGAYTVLLEDGGSPVVDGVLVSTASVVNLPGAQDIAGKEANLAVFLLPLTINFTDALDFDLDIVFNAFLAPFISSWNGSASLLDDIGGKQSSQELENYKIHATLFPHPVRLWYV